MAIIRGVRRRRAAPANPNRPMQPLAGPRPAVAPATPTIPGVAQAPRPGIPTQMGNIGGGNPQQRRDAATMVGDRTVLGDDPPPGGRRVSSPAAPPRAPNAYQDYLDSRSPEQAREDNTLRDYSDTIEDGGDWRDTLQRRRDYSRTRGSGGIINGARGDRAPVAPPGPRMSATSYADEPAPTPDQQPAGNGIPTGVGTPGETGFTGGSGPPDTRRWTRDANGIRRFTPTPFIPRLGQWGEFGTPQGDGFTGVRNGQAFFRGVLRDHAVDGDNIAGDFKGFLRVHLPILNAQQPANSPERLRNEALLASLGGPAHRQPDGTPAGDGITRPGGPPKDSGTTPGAGGSGLTRGPNQDPFAGIPQGWRINRRTDPGGSGLTRGPGQDPISGIPRGTGPGGIDRRTNPDGSRIPPSTPPPPGSVPGAGEVGGGDTARWNPTTGIVDRIRGIDPQKIDGSSYTPEEIAEIERAEAEGYDADGYDPERAPDADGYDAEGYDAEGYEAERGDTKGYKAGGYDAHQGESRDYDADGYDAEGTEAETTKENLSGAVARISNADSPIMQRQRALAEERMNARGLGNSSMAIQAGESAVLDAATNIGAGDVQSEQFNVTSINQARATSVEARNKAREFAALAKNTANRDNAAEYNKMAAENMRAANDAERFLAEAGNKSREFSAGESNKMTALNVTQSNEARRVSSEARNTASAFMAASANEAAKFNTAETNATGRFNAQLASDAAKFSADASNQAKQFEAAAKNTASLFNSGEANKRALEAAKFATDASRFAAEMDQASKEFNATAFNQAQQRYADAMNAATAAQNDAENLSRRDTAQIRASADENNARIRGTRDASERQIASQLEQLGMTLDQRDTESIRDLGGRMFDRFQSGLNILMQTEMEPESRQNAIHNYMSVWSYSPYLPFDLNLDAFPPGGDAPPPGTTPPPPGTTPPPPGATTPGSGLGRGSGPPTAPR